MTTNVTTNHRVGMFDWVDLTTPDPEAACAFYSTVFGWTFEHSTTPMGTYHVASAGGHQVGGIMAGDPSSAAPPSWTVFVRVASIDETVASVTNSGGKVHAGPFDIPGDARVAVVADSTGAVFSVISAGPEPMPNEPRLLRNEPGAVAWCEVLTRDPHAAISFYDAVFGWTAALDAGSGYTMLRLGETDVAGLLPMPDEIPDVVPSYWAIYIGADDIDATVSSAVTAGGSVLKPATTVSSVTFAVLADPTGASFGVMSLHGM